MQATLFALALLPPPAAFALVLVGKGGAGAGLAADADETLLVQRIKGHVEHADIVPDVLRAPVGQRVELGQAAALAGETLVVFH